MLEECLDRLNILDRTFGLEIEFADVDKSGVTLPDGFVWSKEEDCIVNTNGRLCGASARFGGEVNTPPLKICHADLERLRFVFNELLRNGARITWVCSIHVHIYIGDLGLEDLKRLFALTYYTGRFIKHFSDLEDWNDQAWYLPCPKLDEYEKAMKAGSERTFFAAFENSSRKGYMRHIVNVASFFKRKTVEFRNFNATYDFDSLIGCVMFGYRFVDYALTHGIDDYKKIVSLDMFLSELKIHKPAPAHTPPLITSGDMKVFEESKKGRDVAFSSKAMSVLIDNVSGEKLCTVNPSLYSAEMSLFENFDLTIYNNDELNDILYKICKEGLAIHYKDGFYFLEDLQDGSKEMQIVCLLLFHRLHKYVRNDSDYYKIELEGYQRNLMKSVSRIRKTADRLVSMFDRCKYVRGTLNDAIHDNDTVFFQLGSNTKVITTARVLRGASDYNLTFERAECNYYNFPQSLQPQKRLMMLSRNEYLPMKKIARLGDVIFYSSITAENQKISIKSKPFPGLGIITKTDGLHIDGANLLSIVEVTPTNFSYLQEACVEKVHKVKTPRFCFFVMYGDITIGGFGFDFPKSTYKEYDLCLSSDFCVDNRINRGSKLILLCVKSQYVKRLVQRKIRSAVYSMYTKAFTQNPVSMKYRGIFTKNKDLSKPGTLIYTSNFGESGSFEDIIKAYKGFTK